MKSICKDCPVYQAGTCKCKDCNNICKQGPTGPDGDDGKHRRKSDVIVSTRKNFFSGKNIDTELTQLSDTELRCLLRLTSNELKRRQFSRRLEAKRMRRNTYKGNSQN